MSKYKVGDKVLIKKWDDMVDEFGINEYCNHINTNIAFTSNMKQFCNNFYEIIFKDNDKYKLRGTNGYSFIDDMIERKVIDMTKKDLRSGMIIEIRKGYRFITIVKENGEIHFMNLDGITCLGNCDLLDDMTDSIDSNYDIVKIYKMSDTLKNCKTTQDLIWERQEKREMTIAEIEKELGYSIKIIKDDFI